VAGINRTVWNVVDFIIILSVRRLPATQYQGGIFVIKATVYVTIKKSVLDPQGNAVQGALHSLGFNEVEKVRIGKYLEVTLNTTDRAEAESQVRAMCEKLLANTVIEDYRFELEGA
jgi:phosphoribosylformylglycinamidine synthase PurS subunit